MGIYTEHRKNLQESWQLKKLEKFTAKSPLLQVNRQASNSNIQKYKSIPLQNGSDGGKTPTTLDGCTPCVDLLNKVRSHLVK